MLNILSVYWFYAKRHINVCSGGDSRAQHGLSPSGNLINMHKIGKIASVGFNSQLFTNT